jgi:hypothetical protein
MRGTRPQRLALGAAAALLSLAGAGAWAATGGANGPAPGPGARAAGAGPRPGRLLRADGLGAVRATPLFTLANGDSVSLVSAGGARCLLRSRRGQPDGEACAAGAGTLAGQGITVTDECAAGSPQRMEITGLAPEGTVSVRLRWSDGGGQDTAVLDGAFRFEGTNPGPADPYPVGVEWLDRAGAASGTAPLPVRGEEFCLPAG